MTNIKLISNSCELEIDLNGGRIVKLIKDGKEVLGTFNRIDGKQGNTHLCVPNFANEGVEKYGLPFHGPSRNNEWKILEQTEDSVTIFYELKNIGNYPGYIGLTQKFEINENFSQKITLINLGETRTPINLGIHNYFKSDKGWQGIKINGVEVSKTVEISDYVELKDINNIEIPGKENIIWKTIGFRFAKLWTGFREEDGKKIFDNNYVCIEPVRGKEGFLETPESEIERGSVLIFEQQLS